VSFAKATERGAAVHRPPRPALRTVAANELPANMPRPVVKSCLPPRWAGARIHPCPPETRTAETHGNTGLTKKPNRAPPKAVGARLARFQFKDASTTATDVNDLARAGTWDGRKEAQVEAASGARRTATPRNILRGGETLTTGGITTAPREGPERGGLVNSRSNNASNKEVCLIANRPENH